MKKLIGFLSPYRVEAALGPFFKLLEASFELFIPIVVASLIDKGIGGGDNGHIFRMTGLMAALSLIGLVCSVTAQYFAAKAAVGFSSALRAETFSHIQSLSYSDLDSVGSSTLITRLTGDIDAVQNGLNLTLRLLLRSPFVVFGAMIMAFTIDTRAAMIFVGVIIALSAVVFGIMLVSMPIYGRVQSGLDRILTLTRENLGGARVIRAFCREKAEKDGFSAANNSLSSLQMLAGRVSAAMNPITFLIINIASAALIYSGALSVDGGSLTRGEVVALCNYMAQILVELIKLANLIISISKAIACASRVSQVLEAQPEMTAPSEPPVIDENAPAIEFVNASMRYRGAAGCALEAASFTIRRGAKVGIIGGTGAGKSTLVSLIPRFYDCESGCVRVFGRDVKTYPFDTLRGVIGFVPQKALLFRGSVRDNILYGNAQASDGEIFDALEAARAAETVANFKEGLDYTIEQGGKNLSGGQRQRLTIARALVRRPRILILDDSSSALDAATDAALRRSLSALPKETTVITVSQRVSSVKGCEMIITLDDGKIAGIGTHDELLADCPCYREIAESQEAAK